MIEATFLRLVVADRSGITRHLFEVILGGERDVDIVASFATWAECVSSIDAAHPDLVLVDVDLAARDDWSLVRKVAEGAAVVVTRGELEPSSAVHEAAREAGAVAILAAPTVGTLMDEHARKAFITTLWTLARSKD